MNFHLFVQNNDFPVETRKLLLSALQAFFKTPSLRPYTDAIARSGTQAQKDRSYRDIKSFSKLFVEYLESPDAKNAQVFSDQWDKHIADQNSELKPFSGLLFKSHLNKTLFWRFAPYVNALQLDILELGSQLLAKEHKRGMKALDEERFCSFEEYCYACWRKSQDGADIMRPTVHQWYGYMRYAQHKLRPFAAQTLHTENKKQAVNFLEKLNSICHKLAKQTRELHTLTKTYNTIESAIKQNRQLKGQMIMSYALSTGVHPNKDPQCPEELKMALATLNEAYWPMNRQRAAIKREIESLNNQYTDNGELDKSDKLYTECQAELHYWTVNFPRFRARRFDIQRLYDFSLEKTQGHDILYRYVSEGEYKNLLAIKQFNQSPTHCLEREKWFFYKGGNPGDGVTHPIECTVFLKKGALDLLLELQQKDGLYATVVGKDNEYHCIGIHEDALWAYNGLVEKVMARETKSGKVLKSIDFSKMKSEPEPIAFEPQSSPKPLVFEFHQMVDKLEALQLDEILGDKKDKKGPQNS